MVGTMATFGCIFRFDEKEYVFLAQTSEIIYAARILDIEMTHRIVEKDNERMKMNFHRPHKAVHPLYCFTILRTKDFEGRMANLGKSQFGDAGSHIPFTGQTLIKEDIIDLREKIISPDAPLPLELKESIRSLSIT